MKESTLNNIQNAKQILKEVACGQRSPDAQSEFAWIVIDSVVENYFKYDKIIQKLTKDLEIEINELK